MMSKLLLLLCCVVLPATAIYRVPDAEKKPLPPMNWARERKIDIKHLAIDLRFDWKQKQAYGVTAVTFSPFVPTSQLSLDAAFFTVNSVTTAAGTPLQFKYDGGDKNDNLRVTLDRVVTPGEDFTVKIDYRTNWVSETDPNNLGGSNGKGMRFFEPTSNDPLRPREIWSTGDPESNRYWFPSFDAPNDLRTTDVSLTVDKGLTALSNGRLVETKDNSDGTRTFHWTADQPYSNHLTSFVVGEYTDVPLNYEGLQLHNFGYHNESKAVAATMVRLPDMIRFFSEVTGAKYPFPTYTQAFVQDLPWGLGNNTLATQTENMIDDDRIHADYFYLWDGLEAEALAQQWFGNHLACRDWSDVWLNRGFAHYFDGLYNEHKNGRAEFLMWQLLGDQSTYLADWQAGVRHPIVTRNYENAAAFTSDNYSYSRGAMVLHILRKHLGEDRWWKAIRTYLKANAGKHVSTEDFRKAVEEASGESMDWFFNQWLYRMGHPVFEVTKNYDAEKKQLTLRVKQTQTVDPNDDYPQAGLFAGNVEIELDDRIEKVWLKAEKENVFTFVMDQQPRLVNFDYESTWIKELKFEKSLDELLYQLQNDRDVLGRRSAILELVKLAREQTADKEKICDGFRRLILTDVYWRVRQTALGQLQGLLAPATETKPVKLDEATIAMLLTVIKNHKSWNRAAALNFLGMTRDQKFVDLYLGALNDESDRVINAAAVALGKTKSPRAFAALTRLVDKASWKNQSLMNALAGLKELGDPRGFDIAFKALANTRLHRWRLPTPPVWDLRVFAVDTIVSLGRGEAVYTLLRERFNKSMEENDVNGIFNNALLIAKLGDPRGEEVFALLKTRFKDDANAINAVNQYEAQFKELVKR